MQRSRKLSWQPCGRRLSACASAATHPSTRKPSLLDEASNASFDVLVLLLNHTLLYYTFSICGPRIEACSGETFVTHHDDEASGAVWPALYGIIA